MSNATTVAAVPGDSTPRKKKMNAHALADKVRSGASFQTMRAELDLSESGMHRVFEKLVAGGFLRQDEVPPVQRASLRDSRILPTVKCPKCGQPQLATDEFCRGCGTVLDEKDGVVSNGENPHLQRGKTALDVALTPPIAKTPEQLSSGSDGARSLLRTGSIALSALVILGILAYSGVWKTTSTAKTDARITKPAPPAPRASVYTPMIQAINRFNAQIRHGISLNTHRKLLVDYISAVSDLEANMTTAGISNPDLTTLLRESIDVLNEAEKAFGYEIEWKAKRSDYFEFTEIREKSWLQFQSLSTDALALMKQ